VDSTAPLGKTLVDVGTGCENDLHRIGNQERYRALRCLEHLDHIEDGARRCRDVRFTPTNGRRQRGWSCPLSADTVEKSKIAGLRKSREC